MRANKETNDERICKKLKSMLPSSHINFLFGAGVNGDIFPQTDGFIETLSLLEQLLKERSKEGQTLEEKINLIRDSKQRGEVRECFKKELNNREPNFSVKSKKHLDNLLTAVYEIVSHTQNRNNDMKQINIFTLNYDDIVEKSLSEMGYLFTSVSASNIETRANLFNTIGYDYMTQKYVPSFLISNVYFGGI